MVPTPAAGRSSRAEPASDPVQDDADRPLEVLIHVQVRPDTDLVAFEYLLASSPALVAAWQVTGEFDYAVHLACRSLRDIEAETLRVGRHPGVRRTSSQLLLHTVPGAA